MNALIERLRIEGDLVRKLCPDCPDGQVWTSKGPTGELCQTCDGTAFVWVKEQAEASDER